MKKENEATTSTVARINNVEIVIVENGEKRIPIRPICDALGISYQGQIDKIKTDEILGPTLSLSLRVDDEISGSVTVTSTATGADGKNREMQTIPFKFVFGWLFTINPKNVAPEAREAVVKYKLECYNALYDHFTGYAEFIEQKESLIEQQLQTVDKLRIEFNAADKRMKNAKAELDRVRKVTFPEWKADQGQLKLFSDTEMEG